MKKSTKMAISFIMTMVMLMACTSLAFADISKAGETTVTGTGTVTNPVVSVVMPTTLPFGVDPYQIMDKGQINAAEFTLANKSNVPVLITATYSVKGGKDVVFASTASAISPTDTAVTAKAIYMTVNCADSVSPGAVWDGTKGTMTAGTTNGAAYVYSTATTGSAVLSTSGSSFQMLLEKAPYKDGKTFEGPISSAAGISAFTFEGSMNPAPATAWAGADVTVSVKYNLRALTQPEYTADAGSKIGLNLLPL